MALLGQSCELGFRKEAELYDQSVIDHRHRWTGIDVTW